MGTNHLKIRKRQCMWSTAEWSFQIILRHISEQTLNSETKVLAGVLLKMQVLWDVTLFNNW